MISDWVHKINCNYLHTELKLAKLHSKCHKRIKLGFMLNHLCLFWSAIDITFKLSAEQSSPARLTIDAKAVYNLSKYSNSTKHKKCNYFGKSGTTLSINVLTRSISLGELSCPISSKLTNSCLSTIFFKVWLVNNPRLWGTTSSNIPWHCKIGVWHLSSELDGFSFPGR